MLAHLHAPVCRSPGPSVQFLAGDLSPRFLELWLQPPSVASIPSSGLRPTSKQPCPKGLLAPPASQAPRMQREGLATRSQGGENGWAVWPWPQKAGLGLSHVIFLCTWGQLPASAAAQHCSPPPRTITGARPRGCQPTTKIPCGRQVRNPPSALALENKGSQGLAVTVKCCVKCAIAMKRPDTG